jgi:hypothetical protein
MVFTVANARERVKSGTKYNVLGFEVGISLCEKMVDFNPCYTTYNTFIPFLYIQTDI